MGVDDLNPQLFWMRFVLEAQGFKVTENVVYEDNQRSMKLEKHSQTSSGKQTRHINICYFFVTNHIQENKKNVAY